jgi:Methyltransferase domain
LQPNTCGASCRGGNRPPAWFQNNYEPEFGCRHERRIGRLGDGGKWVCDPHRITYQKNNKKKKDDCLIFSVGSNNDFSFEAAVQAEIGSHCEIHTFDFTNYTERANENGVIFHQWGIDAENRRNGRGHQFKTLATTIQELDLTGRTIDVFKIDCEGCELTSFESWAAANVTLRQILVEVHAGKDAMTQPQSNQFFEFMHRQGYVITHKEPNIHYCKLVKTVAPANWEGRMHYSINMALTQLLRDFSVSFDSLGELVR